VETPPRSPRSEQLVRNSPQQSRKCRAPPVSAVRGGKTEERDHRQAGGARQSTRILEMAPRNTQAIMRNKSRVGSGGAPLLVRSPHRARPGILRVPRPSWQKPRQRCRPQVPLLELGEMIPRMIRPETRSVSLPSRPRPTSIRIFRSCFAISRMAPLSRPFCPIFQASATFIENTSRFSPGQSGDGQHHDLGRFLPLKSLSAFSSSTLFAGESRAASSLM